MRKPLCSLGKLFAQELGGTVCSGVLWHSIAHKVVLVVDLPRPAAATELKFADEAIATAICTSKDAMVQVRLCFTLTFITFL